MPVLLLLCFVVSGASSLALELVWTRQLALVFGSTTLAISTVLAAFMGGLALGGWIGGRIADRLRGGLLLAYAGAEAGIALLALAIPPVLAWYPAANAWLWRHLDGAPTLLALARLGLCVLLLALPTTLMGATLPLLARAVIRTPEHFGSLGRRVGALYAANTAGAVVGAAGTGFWLLAAFGLRRTNLVAVVADLALAAAIAAGVLVGRWRRRRADAEGAPDVADTPVTLDGEALAPERAEPAGEPGRGRGLALLAYALSGLVAMTLEVLLARALAMVIGSSTYSFTLVLVVFLLGLAVGAAWIGRPAASSRDPVGALAIVFAALGAAIVLAVLVVDDLPDVFLALLEGSRLEVGDIMGVQALVAGLALAPIAAALGAVMPIAIRAYAGSVDAVGRDVGRAYAANTIGAIVGSLAGGFVVLPLIGLERGVRGCAVVAAAVAGLLAWRARPGRARRAVAVLAPVLAVLALALPRWDTAALTAGVFRISIASRFVTAGKIYKPELLWYKDGASTTVSVDRHGERLSMKNNGKVEASSAADMPTQILVGLMPVMLHEGPARRVAVIGYGSGVTVGAIAEAPEVEHLDVVEIEPVVYEAADRFFGRHNHQPDRNPRVHRHVGDGRNFLTAREERYDVIVSEPSNPWIAGVATLFSREFYREARGRLRPGGLFCQWAQLYELGPRNVKTIYRTFHETFPHVYAFSADDLSADTILVGSLEPLPLALARLDARFAEPRLAAELDRAGVRTADDLVAMLILAPDEIASFAAGGDIHTDDNGRLEFTAPRDLLAAGRTTRFADKIYADLWPYGHLDELVRLPGDARQVADRRARLARALVAHGKRREAATWVDRARAEGAGPGAEAVDALLHLARMRDFADPELPLDAAGPPIAEPAPEHFDPALPADERHVAARQAARARQLAIAGRWEEGVEALREVPTASPTDAGRDLELVRGFLLYKTGRFRDAAETLAALEAVAGYAGRRPAVIYYLGRVRYGDGNFQEGAALLERFAREHPDKVFE